LPLNYENQGSTIDRNGYSMSVSDGCECRCGGTSGRSEEITDNARAKINATTRVMAKRGGAFSKISSPSSYRPIRHDLDERLLWTGGKIIQHRNLMLADHAI
jgi:hypothetical protein